MYVSLLLSSPICHLNRRQSRVVIARLNLNFTHDNPPNPQVVVLNHRLEASEKALIAGGFEDEDDSWLPS
jgi:hypothetical protein